MDLRKTGKLIAKLRNEKGLTQQELGNMIGVGFRAVSKWERGLNLPDIENINELSKIFGISSDEILHGELKLEEVPIQEVEEIHTEIPVETPQKKKTSLTIKITISVLTTIIILITSLIIFNTNKEYVYDLQSINEEDCFIQGELRLRKNELMIILSQLKFKDTNFSSTKMRDYEYKIYANDNLIFGYSETLDGNKITNGMTIEDFTNTFKINYSGKTKLKPEKINEDTIYIKLIIWDIQSNEIIKDIYTIVKPK